jgi:ABC-2 type transport system permease protein
VRRIAWIIRKEFGHIKADPLMSRLIVFPVLVQLFVIGYALTTEVRHTRVAVVDEAGSVYSRQLVNHIAANPLFDYQGAVESRAGLGQLLDNGAIHAGVVIPADFSRRLKSSQGAAVQLVVDGQDANSSTVATGYLRAIIAQWMMDYLKQQLGASGLSLEELIPVKVTSQILFNPQLLSTWYMIPALVVLLVTIITSLLTGLSLVREKERGTLEQLLVTPIKPYELIVGKTVPFVVIGLGEIVVFLLIATLWFRIPFRGNFFVLFMLAGAYMVSSLGIGVLTSTLARTSQQVLFTIWFLLFFFILLGGFFIPVENMPRWVQYVTYVNPVRYFMEIVRALFLKGAGIAQLWQEGVAMLGIGIAVIALSLLFFNRKAT